MYLRKWRSFAEMNPELVKQTKEEQRSRQACSLAKDSNARRAPTASKGTFRSAQGPNPRVPCGQEEAPDMPPASAKEVNFKKTHCQLMEMKAVWTAS